MESWYRILFPVPLIRTIANRERKGLGGESAASTAVERLKADPEYKPRNLMNYCRDPHLRVTPVWGRYRDVASLPRGDT